MAAASVSNVERPELGFESMSHFALDTDDLADMLQNMDFCSGQTHATVDTVQVTAPAQTPGQEEDEEDVDRELKCSSDLFNTDKTEQVDSKPTKDKRGHLEYLSFQALDLGRIVVLEKLHFRPETEILCSSVHIQQKLQ
ncbi:hypothetical protein F2P81_024510 [Scophthalmus maximus]|uniref:COS domain-containing protein n=1 Tax=Scophthalmus maximus TaxID=52904 RepID=A0A6A4RX31_SCOMX|nr:hypothetical protein F2P81_024510 [Scophthalmus maximus]